MSHERVQARRRLVAEHDWRIGENLGRERQSLHLSARETFDSSWLADYGVPTFGQGELERDHGKGEIQLDSE